MGKIIFYVGGMKFPDKNAAAQRVVANCKILNNIGYKIVLAGVNKSQQFAKNIGFIKAPYVGEFECFTVPYPNSTISWFNHINSINSIIKLLNKYNKKDIFAVIAYNYPAVTLMKLLSYTKTNNIKLIADCTEWYGKSNNIIKFLDTSLRMYFAHKRIKNIICVSDYLEKYYLNMGCTAINIPPLIDEKEDKWKNSTQYKPNTIRIFSYIGSPGTNKEKDRLDIIINAFNKLKIKGYRFKLNIAGITKRNFLEIYHDYKNIVNKMSNEINFLGRLSHIESIKILKESDFSIFARLENKVTRAGFPTKLGESFACGVPVVTNPTSNISRFLINGKNGYIAKDCSVDSLMDAIKNALTTNDDALVKMHDYCKDNNELEYSKFIIKFDNFLRKL